MRQAGRQPVEKYRHDTSEAIEVLRWVERCNGSVDGIGPGVESMSVPARRLHRMALAEYERAANTVRSYAIIAAARGEPEAEEAISKHGEELVGPMACLQFIPRRMQRRVS